MSNPKLQNPSNLLGWASITAGLMVWVAIIFGFSLWQLICNYRLNSAPTSNGESCIYSIRMFTLATERLLASVSLGAGVLGLISARDKPIFYRVLSFIGTILGVLYFIALAYAWFIHD